ncbi:MAG TPA: hypothetical protein VLR90_00195 [Blastocatellia bacterium]|nr:hypothetical protein [Blastocatellia bacterium]
MAETKSISTLRLIFIPSVIALFITLLRLVGELQHWPTALFNREAGGGGALIGISWLPLIFGVYFALKLSEAGKGPEDRGRAVRLSIVGVLLFIAGIAIGAIPQLGTAVKVAIGLVLAVLAIGLQYTGWPKLFNVLLAYGFASRIPVLIVMFIAMRGDWQTHYDVVQPQYAELTFWPKFLLLAFLPQMFLWIVLTIIPGMLTGSIAAAIKQRKNPTAQTAGA